MTYSNRDGLGISIILSILFFLVLFLLFDVLVKIELSAPVLIRPPLELTFFAEDPAPARDPLEPAASERRVAETEPVVAAQTPPSQNPIPVQPAPPRPAPTPRDHAPASRQPAPARDPAPTTDRAPAVQPYVPPAVDWGDESNGSQDFVPAESSIEFGEAPDTVASVPRSQVSRTFVIEEQASRYSDFLARIGARDLPSNQGVLDSTQTADGTSDSPIRSDQPRTLDEITVSRKLISNPAPVLSDGFNLGGQRELIVDVYFEIRPMGAIENLQFLTETGYPELDRAIRAALTRWRFEAVSDPNNMRVRMSYRVRAR